MKQLKSSAVELRRLFEDYIPAASIAEPFVSFDESTATSFVLGFMREHDYDVVGIRNNGLPIGFVFQTELASGGGSLPKCIKSFDDNRGLSEWDSMLDALRIVGEDGRAFVKFAGRVAGIITRGDLQKVPVRMWLFNLISLLEMHMLRLIRERYPDSQWRDLVQQERIEAAERVLKDRRSRNEATDLADCLQFSDKRCILVKTDDLNLLFGDSRKSGYRFLKRVEDLRNELAHSQDIISGNWPILVDLSMKIEKVLTEAEAKCGLQ